MKPQIINKILFSFLLLIFVFCLEATATVRYVSKTGSSTSPYTSWITASDSIQKCIDYSIAGDTIYVGNGEYKEKIVINNKFLTLIGSGWDSCIVDSRELSTPTDYHTFYIDGGANIEGFNIIVSDNQNGNGIVADNFSTNTFIQNNKIEGARIGVWIFNSHLTCRLNLIVDAATGIVLEAFDENYFPVIDSNIIVTAVTGLYTYGIRGSFGTSATIRNNIIIAEERGSGLNIILNPLEIRNNLVGKINDYSRDGYYFSLGNGIIENNLSFSKSTVNGMRLFRGSNKVKNNNMITGGNGYKIELPDSISFRYNNAWDFISPFVGFTPDSTNTTADPMVISKDSSDFHLQMYSPLIDAGDPSILDRDGSRSDIGLYGGPLGETYTYLDLAPKSPRNLSAIVDTNKITLKWNKNTEADTGNYKVYRDTIQNFIIDSTKLVTSSADTFFVQLIPPNISRYVYKVTCADKQGNESNPSEEIFVNITSINEYPMTINDYILYQNYPNPFNPSTIIGYRVKERNHIKLIVYDIKGELVKVLVNQEQGAGYYEVDFNLSNIQKPVSSVHNFASGIYLYKIDIINQNQMPVFTKIRKMVYIK